MEDAESPNFYKRVSDFGLVLIIQIMAILLILYSLFGLYRTITHGEEFSVAVAHLLPLICSILIILDSHRSVFFAVGLYAISIGGSRAVTYFTYMMLAESYDFYVYLVMTLMGANLFYSGYRYIIGQSRSIYSILLGTLFFIVVLAIELVVDLQSMESLFDYLNNNKTQIVLLGLYLIYMCLVWTDQIRSSMIMAHTNSILQGLRLASVRGLDFSVHKPVMDDIQRFYAKDPSFNVPADIDKGPVFAEYNFQIYDRSLAGYGRLQRWDYKDGPVYLTISDHSEGSYINPYVFEIRKMVFEDPILTITFSDHGMASFRTRVPEDDDGPIRWRDEREVTEDEDIEDL